MTHSESVQPLQSVKLVYQPCSQSRGALEHLRNRWWTLMILMMKMLTNDYCLCYSLFMLTWSCVYGFMDKLVATQLLKWWQLKANRSKPVSAFWASWTPCYICWVQHVLTLALLFKSLEKFWMGTKLLEFGGIRLVINQSVVPMDLESSPEDRSCLSAVCYLRL